MSVDIWNEGDLFTCRIYKRLASRSDLLWANTYELRVTAAGAGRGADDARTAVEILGLFESTLHLSDVQFDRGVFSTFVQDGQPYDPDTFVSFSLTELTGNRTAAGDALPLQMCLLVRKQVRFGRAGRLLYRRVLAEADITAPSGDATLTEAITTGLNNLLDDPIGDGDNIFDALNTVGLDLVMAGVAGGVTRIRGVNGLNAAGVVNKPYNNRYFDRVAQGTPTP